MSTFETTPNGTYRKYRSLSERRALAAKAERKERARERRHNIAHKFGALALLIGGVGGIGQYVADDAMLIPRNTLDLITEHGADPVSDAIQKSIDAEAEAPANPRVAKLLHDQRVFFSPIGHEFDGDGKLTGHDMTYYNHHQRDLEQELASESASLSQEIAAENGLHLVDVAPYLERIDQATGLDQVMEIVQQYTAQLGPHLVFNMGHDLRDYVNQSVHPAFDPSAFEMNDELKINVKNALTTMSRVPLEVYTYADIDEIRVTNSMGFTSESASGSGIKSGVTNPETKYIYLDAENIFNGDMTILFHEIGHRIDYKMNHSSVIGAHRDVEYNALNHGDPYGHDLKTTPAGVARIYGATNILEDKATMFENMLAGIDTNLLYSDDTIVRAKYRELLGRLETAVPGYGHYLLETCLHKNTPYSSL
jgi:hypothetical protein